MGNTTKTEKKPFVLKDKGGDLSKDWFIEFYVDGKRKWSRKGINSGKTKAERYALAEKLIQELTELYPPPPPNSRIKSLLYERLEVMAVELSKRTVQDYRSQLNILFEWLGSRTITKARMEKYFIWYRGSHEQTTTYQHRRKLRTIFKRANCAHLLDHIKLRKGKNKPLRYFQKSQEKMLIQWMDEHDTEMALYCRFVRFMAIRPRAELRFIRSCDIFHEERKVCLRAEYTKGREHAYVNIPNTLYNHLEYTKNIPPNHYIFPSCQGKPNPLKPIGRNTIGQRFRALLIQFGFDTNEYGLYSWKHTGAVRLYEHAKDVKVVQVHLRHSNPVITETYLQQLGVNYAKEAVMDFPDIGE